jgi:hypothetical protein
MFHRSSRRWGNWVKQDEINCRERGGLTTGERARLSELERERARLIDREHVEAA